TTLFRSPAVRHGRPAWHPPGLLLALHRRAGPDDPGVPRADRNDRPGKTGLGLLGSDHRHRRQRGPDLPRGHQLPRPATRRRAGPGDRHGGRERHLRAWYVLQTLNGSDNLGWALLAVGAYRARGLGWMPALGVAFMMTHYSGVLKGTDLNSLTGAVLLAAALVPLG